MNLGSFSRNGKSFFPGPHTSQSPSRLWPSHEVRSLLLAPGEHPIYIYISLGAIIAVTSDHSLVSSEKVHPALPLGLQDLPAFIALPRDGRPIIPRSRVTALVEAQEA